MAVSLTRLFKVTCAAVSISWLGSQGLLFYHLKFAKTKNPILESSTNAIPLNLRESRKSLVDAVMGLYELDYNKERMKLFEENATFEDPAVFLNGKTALASAFSKMAQIFRKSENLKADIFHDEKMVAIDQVQRYTLPGNFSIEIPSTIYLSLSGQPGNEKIARVVEEWYSKPIIGQEAPYFANIGYMTRQFRRLHGLPFQYIFKAHDS